MDQRRRDRPRVLVVEDNADLARGHYAPLLRRTVAGFDAAGYDVTALTSIGLGAPEHHDPFPPVPVRRYRPPARWLERRLRRFDPPLATGAWPLRLRPLTARVRSLLLIAETRHASRTLGPATDVGVVVLSPALQPLHGAELAPADGRWASFRHMPTGPVRGGGLRSLLSTATVHRVVVARHRRRTDRGGRFVVVGGYPALADSWRERMPWVSTGVVPLPVEPTVAAVDRAEARRILGLPPTPRLALSFGSIDNGKSPETVWAAWCLDPRPDADLVAVGHGVQASLDQWLDAHAEADASLIHVVDGTVDDATKHLLFSAADIGICSFTSEPIGTSATFTDFAGYGRPVCCSSGGDPALLTIKYGLGSVFEAENASALRRAVAHVGDAVDPEGLRAYLADYSGAQVAGEFVRLLFPGLAEPFPVAPRAPPPSRRDPVGQLGGGYGRGHRTA